MALLKCYECGGQVSSDAAACPRCGAPSKRPATATLAIPPILAAEHGFSDEVKLEIVKRTKMGLGQRICWFAFGLNLAAYIFNDNERSLPVCCVCGIFLLRGWFRRCTYRLMFYRDSYKHIYWQAFWGFMWRYGLAGFLFSFIMSLFAAAPNDKLFSINAFGSVLFLWFFFLVFVWDVPIWCCKDIKRLTNPPPLKTVLHGPTVQTTAAQ